jgi:repressor LexA
VAKPLTPRQRQIFKFIKEYIAGNDYPPVYSDIGKAVGLSSTATVFNHIRALEKKGYLKRIKGVSRGLEILVDEEPVSKDIVSVAVLGKISGTTALVEDSISQTKVLVPKNYFGDADEDSCFALSVYGDGLITEGLLDGDNILFEYAEKSADGNIALVQLNNGVVTIRKTKSLDSGVNLISATSSLQNFVVNDLKILGIVKGVFRQY